MDEAGSVESIMINELLNWQSPWIRLSCSSATKINLSTWEKYNQFKQMSQIIRNGSLTLRLLNYWWLLGDHDGIWSWSLPARHVAIDHNSLSVALLLLLLFFFFAFVGKPSRRLKHLQVGLHTCWRHPKAARFSGTIRNLATRWSLALNWTRASMGPTRRPAGVPVQLSTPCWRGSMGGVVGQHRAAISADGCTARLTGRLTYDKPEYFVYLYGVMDNLQQNRRAQKLHRVVLLTALMYLAGVGFSIEKTIYLFFIDLLGVINPGRSPRF